MELNQKKHDIENIADAMEGGGSGGGGDFQIIRNPQYYNDDNNLYNIYRYESDIQRWQLYATDSYLCVLPENFDISKLTFIGFDNENGYIVYYMPLLQFTTTQLADTVGDRNGAYIMDNTNIYCYNNDQGVKYTFIAAGVNVEIIGGDM